MRTIGKTEHLPVEIFGFVPEDKSEIAQKFRNSKICPFTAKICIKQEYRTKKPPTGACVASHLGKPHIICPNRFYENDFSILWDALRLSLGHNIKAVLVPEIDLKKKGMRKKIGRLDWSGVKLGSNGEIDNFIGIEVVSNQTTGKLTDALAEFSRAGRFSKTKYNFSLNTYMQVKTFFTQCLTKGHLFDEWSKKYVWIMQDFLYEDWVTRFNLQLKKGVNNGNFIFFVCSLIFNDKEGKYQLKLKEVYSATYKQLLEAYTAPLVDYPDINQFLDKLKSKILYPSERKFPLLKKEAI